MDDLDTAEEVLFDRARRIARPVYDSYVGLNADVVNDEDAPAVAFMRFIAAIEAGTARAFKSSLSKCGWCVRAAGDTEEAWESVAVLTIDEHREHAQTCGHNPLVERLQRAETMLAAARAGLDYLARHIDGYDMTKEIAEDIAAGRRDFQGDEVRRG